MDAAFKREDAEMFFARLGFPAGQFRELRLIDPHSGRVAQRYCNTVVDAVALAGDASGRLNVYVGACPRSTPNGTRAAVTTASAAWADLDFHQLDPTNREVALELAYRRIEALGIRPTMMVNSGNGLQLWWLLHQPVSIGGEWPADRLEAINRGIAERLGGDHVHDLARVLRVPGTMNLPTTKKRARGCVPVMARLLDAGGPTYSIDDLRALAAIEKPRTAASIARPAMPVDIDHKDDEIVSAFRELLAQIGSGHPLVRTWHGDRLLNDDSRSGWDMALVNQLVLAGIKDEFIPAIVRAYPKGRGVFATSDYLARTLAKARSLPRGRHGTPRTA